MYPLNNSARDYLLKAARSTIEAYLRSGVRPVPDPPSARELLQKRGAFVTLYLRGRLRGCVGYAWPLTPLYRAVPECAVSAAVEDLRFRPLHLKDLPETEIELSVLSGLDRVGGASDILVGTHACWSARRRAEACCCRKSRWSTDGPLSSFWNRPV